LELGKYELDRGRENSNNGGLTPVSVKSLFVPVLVLFAAAAVSAQPVKPVTPARSFSGQFTALELGARPKFGPAPIPARVPIAGSFAFLLTAPPVSPLAEDETISLVPELLVDSCERIKELFLLELGLRDEWNGRIRLLINPTMPKDGEASLTATFQPDGWKYDLELPKKIRPQTLAQAVVQVLLTEMANRKARSHSAEIPYWLTQGMTAHLWSYSLPTFILRPNVQTPGAENVRIEGLAGVRRNLLERTPLSFQRLSWPEAADATGQGEALYRSCAQLFFESLLQLRDGRKCLRDMFDGLPACMNWQTAFLAGFHSHFTELLDVEKWWSLTCVGFTSSDLTAPKSAQECWRKLQEALDVPVEVHLDKGRMPAEARLTLQEAVMQWESAPLRSAIERTVRDLQDLQLFAFRCDVNLDAAGVTRARLSSAQNAAASQWRVEAEFSPLVGRYLTVLISYLKQTEPGVVASAMGKPHPPSYFLLKKDLARQLNTLDRERMELYAKFAPAGRRLQFSDFNSDQSMSGTTRAAQLQP
jgi:hypothetical protein